MSLVEDFRIALTASAVDLPSPELLPERLARACSRVLPVDGAGISMFFASDRRLPLGASDEVSAEAERLQFTVGEGPCLSARAEGRVMVSDEADIAARWPTFHSELVTRTPIRGIISLPLAEDLASFGALDLYVVPPQDTGAVTLADALAVTREVTTTFLASSTRAAGTSDGPIWLDAPAAQRRSLVWQAMGFLNAALQVSSVDALAMLRARAYGEGLELDTLAHRVLDREVPVEQLAWDASGT
jgi:hypothetical protein